MTSPDAPTRRRDLALLAGLYVSQFLGVGFLYTALAAILRDRGASLEQLSAIQVVGLVWAVKFLWAPVVDRFGSTRLGHYRGWLVVLQPAIALALLLLIGLDPVADFGALMAVAALVVLLSATQDIAADGLAVRILDERDRGLGNGIQVAGGYLGNILGGGAVLLVYDAYGWPAAIVALAVFTLLPLLQILAFREPTRATPGPTSTRLGFRTIGSIFAVPGVVRWSLVILPLLWLGVGASYALATPMLVDAGWSLTAIGTLTTMVGGAVALATALGGGVLARRLGRKRSVLVLGGVQVLAIVGLLPLATGNGGAAGAVAVVALNATYAAMSAVVYTINMDHCRAEAAGSDFTMLSTVSFALSLVAGAVALNLAGSVGYVGTLLGCAALVVVALVVVARLYVDAPAAAPAEVEA